MRNILFLDIDGVIATPEQLDADGCEWAFSSKCLENLQYIVDNTDGLEIVISSSWRRGDLVETKDKLFKAGMPNSILQKVVGETIRGYKFVLKGAHMSICRGVEIKQWLDINIHMGGFGIYLLNEHGKYVPKSLDVDYRYAILDDDTGILLEQFPHFFECFSPSGLSKETSHSVVSYFQGKGRHVITKQFTHYTHNELTQRTEEGQNRLGVLQPTEQQETQACPS